MMLCPRLGVLRILKSKLRNIFPTGKCIKLMQTCDVLLTLVEATKEIMEY